MAAIRKASPGYRVEDFLTGMQFAGDDVKLFKDAAKRIGVK
jgi:hypothetical protein